MFGLRSKKPEGEVPAGALDRLGRRNSAETRADAQPAAVGKEARLASVAAALHDAVAPRLRDMVKAGAAAGDQLRPARSGGRRAGPGRGGAGAGARRGGRRRTDARSVGAPAAGRVGG